jgi:cytochrome c oxidase subunit 3
MLLAAAAFLFALAVIAFIHPAAIGRPGGDVIGPGGWGILAGGILAMTLAIAMFASEGIAHPSTIGGSGDDLAGPRTGVAAFILSEAVFFAVLLGSYLYFALGQAKWPPAGIDPPQIWNMPAFNTCILLVSGSAAVVAHHSFLLGRLRAAQAGLALAIGLGLVFLWIQGNEFLNASFSFSDGAYPSVFLIATGSHAVHVLIGVILLGIALARLRAGHFSRNSHFGLEAPIWYWHFADVVWIFLFAILYVWTD